MADSRDPISKIEEVSKVSKSKGAAAAAEEVVERVAPNREHFSQLMQQDVAQTPQEGAQRVNFMEEIKHLQKKASEISKASPDTVLQQSRSTIAQIEEVKTKLAQPNVEINPSTQTLLTNKLTHIDESLKVALNRVGTEFSPSAATAKVRENPIERFLGYLTHSQYTLQKLSDDINQMGLNKTEISPASMLAIQMKVGYMTQEVEFFTAILNKALESTKTIMNVQV